ncbi:hypothetical protein [Nocardia rhizosphaerae]|uniref:DUF1772 domain-containing protein n=1 Tax=Nocardia rhizosphaerae TaxID=1691571 RepID=A0ABV8L1V7_9NOCA
MTIALAVLLAVFGVCATIAGVEANALLRPDDDWMRHRVLAMTAAHIVMALLWVIAAVLLGRWMRTGLVLSGALAAGYLGMNAAGIGSLAGEDSVPAVYAGMVTEFCFVRDWDAIALVGMNGGERFTGIGAVLAALMLILVLISATMTRMRRVNSPSRRTQHGHAG